MNCIRLATLPRESTCTFLVIFGRIGGKCRPEQASDQIQPNQGHQPSPTYIFEHMDALSLLGLPVFARFMHSFASIGCRGEILVLFRMLRRIKTVEVR